MYIPSDKRQLCDKQLIEGCIGCKMGHALVEMGFGMMAAPAVAVQGFPGLVAELVQKSPTWELWGQLVSSELELLQPQGHERGSEAACVVHPPLPEVASSTLRTPHAQLPVRRPFH